MLTNRREFIKLCAVALSTSPLSCSISYAGLTSNGLIDPLHNYTIALRAALARKTDDIILGVFE